MTSGAVPRVLVLTDRTALPTGHELERTVEAAFSGGADGVVVRERDLGPDRAALGARICHAARRHGAAAVWAAPVPTDGGTEDNQGLHLRSNDELPAARPPLLGRSCHSIADLRRAAAEGCDYVTLSPIAPTASKPRYGPPLGPAGLRALLRAAAYLQDPRAPRVLALGGVTAANAGALVAAGAYGVAVMGLVMRSSDPQRVAARLRAELGA